LGGSCFYPFEHVDPPVDPECWRLTFFSHGVPPEAVVPKDLAATDGPPILNTFLPSGPRCRLCLMGFSEFSSWNSPGIPTYPGLFLPLGRRSAPTPCETPLSCWTCFPRGAWRPWRPSVLGKCPEPTAQVRISEKKIMTMTFLISVGFFFHFCTTHVPSDG